MSNRPILTLKKRKPKPKPEKVQKPKPKPEKVQKPKPKPKQKSPQPLVESIVSKAKRIDKLLTEKYDMWAKYLPFEIGLGKVILYQYKGDFSWKSVHLTITNHTNKVDYLNNIISMEHRYNLDGKATEDIKPKDKEYSKKKLERLFKQKN